ncbi:MAG TPA: hypothetical protein VNN80_25160 [Polyangiaceae bacterium]|nr:hypothetical protein [Polyangiaceae bacterium]
MSCPRRARAGLVVAALALGACRENLRIGDHVLVEYDGQSCPGYVIDRKSQTRLRVHFDFEGYDWQDDVSIDRVLGKVQGTAQPCALPDRVRATLGLVATPTANARTSPYRVGDRVRVRWRQSIYPATITEVRTANTVVVHYHGHEDVWDEAINVDRIVNERR